MPIHPTSQGDILIRQALPTDAKKLSTLRKMALEENPTSFGASVEQPERWSIQWAEDIINKPREINCLLVAEYGEELLGMSLIRRYPGPKEAHGSTINAVFIKKEWRGLGILQQMLLEMEQWAKGLSLKFIKLQVTTHNDKAHQAYLKFGFLDYGIEPMPLYYEGNYYDEYLMIKYLDQ